MIKRLWASKNTKMADSFTAKFVKHKPLIFLEKVGGLWFLASEKCPKGLLWGSRGILGLACHTGQQGDGGQNMSRPPLLNVANGKANTAARSPILRWTPSALRLPAVA